MLSGYIHKTTFGTYSPSVSGGINRQLQPRSSAHRAIAACISSLFFCVAPWASAAESRTAWKARDSDDKDDGSNSIDTINFHPHAQVRTRAPTCGNAYFLGTRRVAHCLLGSKLRNQQHQAWGHFSRTGWVCGQLSLRTGYRVLTARNGEASPA